jgi:hypothetical protein
MFKFVSCIAVAILTITFASAQVTSTSQFPNQEVGALLNKLKNASVQQLNIWAKHPSEIGSAAEPFCLTRERLILVDLIATSLAERNASSDDAKNAAEIQRNWDTYLLMTFQPAERKQLSDMLGKIDDYFSKGGSLVTASALAVPPNPRAARSAETIACGACA